MSATCSCDLYAIPCAAVAVEGDDLCAYCIASHPDDEQTEVWDDPINAFKYGSPVSGVAGNPEEAGEK